MSLGRERVIRGHLFSLMKSPLCRSEPKAWQLASPCLCLLFLDRMSLHFQCWLHTSQASCLSLQVARTTDAHHRVLPASCVLNRAFSFLVVSSDGGTESSALVDDNGSEEDFSYEELCQANPRYLQPGGEQLAINEVLEPCVTPPTSTHFSGTRATFETSPLACFF